MGEDRVKGERVEVIDIDPELGEVNQDEVAGKALDWINVIQHLGGTVQIGARREEVEPGVFITTRVLFRWSSYMPGHRAAQVEAAPEEPDEELDDRAPESVTAA